jgi:hypothetical protein
VRILSLWDTALARRLADYGARLTATVPETVEDT